MTVATSNAEQRQRQLSRPPVLLGFEHINRYWDRQHATHAAKILPGEYYVTRVNELITTVLGSCISVCIRDPANKVGGMNHFMLPQATAHAQSKAIDTSAAARYGNVAMEYLINSILKYGGRRENLEFKIFGGGRILAQMTDVGDRNIAFIKHYFRTEGFKVAGHDTGDIYPRKVIYNPITGKASIKKLRSIHNNTIKDREIKYRKELDNAPIEGEIDLF
ncbi:MAG: chemotaxis protein CheD [Gammaproteobacteria bacterium]|nr:MAG: chemotaxis protein CheD [Gammaproteobacteria bacterium]